MAEDTSGLTVIDDRTTNLKLELPHQDNKLISDVQRLRDTINMLDTYLKNLAKVASTGEYADLLNIPEIPNADWDATSGKAQILNKPDLADVATSGEYADLKNTPDLVALKKEIVLSAHPVGSYYISKNSTSPATLFGGTWESVRGVFLYAEDDTYGANTTGGNATTTLSVANLPSHNHTASTSNAGSHTHTRGTMNITGQVSTYNSYYSGALYQVGTAGGGWDGDGSRGICGLDASRSWTGATSSNGEHSHTVTVNNTGSGTSFSNMPPLLGVYVWRRTA